MTLLLLNFYHICYYFISFGLVKGFFISSMLFKYSAVLWKLCYQTLLFDYNVTVFYRHFLNINLNIFTNI